MTGNVSDLYPSPCLSVFHRFRLLTGRYNCVVVFQGQGMGHVLRSELAASCGLNAWTGNLWEDRKVLFSGLVGKLERRCGIALELAAITVCT